MRLRPGKFVPFLRVAALLAVMLCLVPAGRALPAQQPASPTASSQSTPEAPSPVKNKEAADENDAYRHSAKVRKIGAMLGMKTERAAFVFELLNFIILAALVGWFLIKTLPKTFRNRSSAIQKHLVDARTATEESRARLAVVEERLARLDNQIADMRTQAEQDSAIEEQRIKATVEEDKKKILAAAEQEIASATLHARKQIQQYAAELAIEQAARKLVVTAEMDRLLVQNFARQLGADDSKEGQN